MKRLLAAALLIGAAPPADGQWSDATPPVRFQGPITAILMTVPPEAMNAACGSTPPPGTIVLACTRWLEGGSPVIIMPAPCLYDATDEYAHVLCHEGAHTRGWSGNHER
jgi:hypothetical protein